MPGTILIVADVATNRILLKSRLAAACYAVAQAEPSAAAAAARRLRPDLVLIDAAQAAAGGLACLRALRADAAAGGVPVVLCAAGATPALRRAAFAAGADGFLDKPLDEGVLRARIRALLRHGGGAPAAAGLHGLAEAAAAYGAAAPQGHGTGAPRIALVAALPEAALRWRAALAPHLPGLLVTLTGADALAGAGAARDLYLVGCAAGAGPALLAELRARPVSRDAALCAVLPRPDPAAEAMALDLGADDVLTEGFDPAEAALRLHVLIARKRAADGARAAVRAGLKAAAVDPLTGLWNRRHALPALGRMTAGRPCAAMLIDIDRFKAVNDRHGHAAGDAVLAAVAARLRAMAGESALIARIGGEEFLAARPVASGAEAAAAADRLRAGIAAEPFALPQGGALAVTVSIGVTLAAPGATAEATLAAADRALLAAKASGRNHVQLARGAA